MKLTTAILLLVLIFQSCSSQRIILTIGQQNSGEKVSHVIKAKVNADVDLSNLLPEKADSARGLITYFIQPDGRILGSNLGVYVLYSEGEQIIRLTDPNIEVSNKTEYTDLQVKVFNTISKAVQLDIDQANQSVRTGIYMYRLPITVRHNNP